MENKTEAILEFIILILLISTLLFQCSCVSTKTTPIEFDNTAYNGHLICKSYEIERPCFKIN